MHARWALLLALLTPTFAIGTTLEIDGKRRAPIAGKDFAKALFGIYLGKSPPSASLKEGLLGR